MANIVDLLRIINTPLINYNGGLDAPKGKPQAAKDLTLSLGTLFPNRSPPKSTSGQLDELGASLSNLPPTLCAAFPYTSTAIAANSDLVRIPVHAEKFRLLYAEALGDNKALNQVLDDAGISSRRVWTPDNEPDKSVLPYLGNIAFYGIEFQKGDIGSYQEFFLLIKLSSKTGLSRLSDMFVWRLAVTSQKAADWGSPWHYPKRVCPEGNIVFDWDKDDLATKFAFEPGTFYGSGGSNAFPGVVYNRKHLPSVPLARWSHEAQMGGFSFVNPKTDFYPQGFLAPIENQGEAWTELYDPKLHDLRFVGDVLPKEFDVLKSVKWTQVFSGRNFEAVAKLGSAIP